jgi:hypothetical protein
VPCRDHSIAETAGAGDRRQCAGVLVLLRSIHRWNRR